MIRLPTDLTTIGDARLGALDAGCERELGRVIKRMRMASPEFDHALTNALRTEAEVERRKGTPFGQA